MAATYKVPTVFSAIDAFSGPLKAMGGSVDKFASKLETGINRGNAAFNRLTPSLSNAGRQALSAAGDIAAAFTIYSSVDSLLQYEKAVASFRTIVSDATNNEFAAYKNQINSIASDTRKSSIDVANSFEKIAGLNSAFAETAEGLGMVSKASIVLSKASGVELGQSAENLVGIMNQFSFAATEADRTINVLAAGQAVGAANIKQTSEAFVNFGSVAKGSNITLEQSVALIQTLGKFSLFGAEAGTKLRGATLKLQQAGVGYKSGQFSINDALVQARDKMDKLSTAKAKDAYLTKIFGAENITAGRILVSNIDLYKDFTAKVTGTSEAQNAARINSDTLTVALDELKNAWTNMLTSSDKATGGMNAFKQATKFVTDNLQLIVTIGVNVLAFFTAFKAALIIGEVLLWAYNVAAGVTAALGYSQSTAFIASASGLAAYNIVTGLATSATWLLNAAMYANPVGLIIGAIVALIALVIVVINKWNEWGAALSLFMGPIGVIIVMVQSFRRNWDMITKAFSEGGILEGLKAIGKTLLDAILMPLSQILYLAAKIPGLGWAKGLANSVDAFRADLGVNVETDESGNQFGTDGKAPLLNPEKTKQETFSSVFKQDIMKTTVVDFKNVPMGTQITGEDAGNVSITPNLGSTFKPK